MFSRPILSACAVLASLPALAHSAAPVSGAPDFNFEVRPILSKHCLACHGNDEGDRKGGLRLDTFEGATAVLDSDYAAVVPASLEDSELWYRVTTEDEDDVMPPPEHGHALSAGEQDILRRWIESGAKYAKHWAFVPPVVPEIPENTLSDWAQGPIDHFVAAGLAEVGLKPSAAADSRILARRVALDLTGLPPTQTQVDLYVSDPTPEAFGILVDELLASPNYGEHWASLWLDLARYADTMGYASDSDRTIWRWRDWVVDAFNQNMPYDEFTRLQLAGDLLPESPPSARLATAFHRNTLNNTEGGTDDEEFRIAAVKDRISTTVNVWMGLTMKCAECHSHKYDPISQTDFYTFLDFFNQTEDADTSDDRPVEGFLPVGAEDIAAKIAPEIEKLAKARLETHPNPDANWAVFNPADASASGNTALEILGDGSVLATGEVPNKVTYSISAPAPEAALTGVRLEVLPDPAHGGNIGRHEKGWFVINHIRVHQVGKDGKRTRIKVADASADRSANGHHVRSLTESVKDIDGWGSDPSTERHEAVLTFARPFTPAPGTTLSVEIIQSSKTPKTSAGRIRLAFTSIPKPAFVYRTGGGLDNAAQEIAAVAASVPEPVPTPVLRELPADARRDTHVNLRGAFNALGDRVEAAVPAAFHPLPEGAPKNRLGVAEWLMAEENPLTARVTVNRYWAQIFGLGIVETEEDFGSQGTAPSHPELLDYLAVFFRDGGWDTKALLREIVTSATYQQSSVVTGELHEKDPRNALLSRGPRFRLPAEVVRDQALAVSGLLSAKMGGPPVFPSNPIARFRPAFGPEKIWKTSEGEDRYRRAIYTYLQRSQPHPLMGTFDMNSRSTCSLRRFRTNTPLQSFQTLNDPSFIEAARALAHKMVGAGGALDPRAAVACGLETALLRPGTRNQIDELVALYADELGAYQKDKPSAMTFAGDLPKNADEAEFAAFTVVANVILNLDAFLTK